MTISKILLRKNNNLDLIRIALASLVIIGHAQFLNGPDSFFPDPLQSLFYFTYSGAIAVKLFFFISGLVVANSLLQKRNAVVFFISRFFRLMPALVLVLLVTILVFGPILTKVPMGEYFAQETYRYIGWNLYFKTRFTLPGVFTDNLYANTVNGSLWSLRYEVGCYLVMLGIFLLTFKIKNKYWYNIPILAIIVVTFFPSGFMQNAISDDPERYLLPACFAFGVFCAVNAEKIRIDWITILIFSIAYALGIGTKFQEILMIYAFSILILFLSSRNFMLKLRPKYDISYGIYLWGFLLQQTLYHYIGHINILLHIAIVLAVATVLAFLTYIGIEKPGMDLGKKLANSFLDFQDRRKEKIPTETSGI